MPGHVPYGYRFVAPVEKRNLVLGHFEAIAQRYDLADTLLSCGLHHLWRRRAMRRLHLRPGDRVLDLCGGTGDFALLAARIVGPAGTVVVCDFSRAMMHVGRGRAKRAGMAERIHWMQGDAEQMGFADHFFDAVIVGYGVRNFVSLENGMREISRVMRPGGKFLAMEFSIPTSPLLRRLYHLYSFHLMPRAGRLITGTDAPFRYLAESIRVFPEPKQFQAHLLDYGFQNAAYEPLSSGLAVLYSAATPQ
ncbi:ubiquinone/menaquinone biosynthesis methyltransferase [Desulfonatronum thioautotrophicum]|uniref:ubiquinone/menaquinone biosynthesis methyltransferase n=1 Tax=Desulfonatronum thioautotrophicum TaxID=617001 RepID=UPI0005EADEAE|nr:ubiquinone/menaquinone biosynthesis methyltransferase [Desulfonatronum thioautotrophicum]